MFDPQQHPLSLNCRITLQIAVKRRDFSVMMATNRKPQTNYRLAPDSSDTVVFSFILSLIHYCYYYRLYRQINAHNVFHVVKNRKCGAM